MNKLSEFLSKLFTKYYYWKNKTFVNVEYLYIATNTGCFFKFPAIKSSWAQKNYKVSDDKLICPNREPNDYFEPIKDNNIYDPRCRHFYYTSLTSVDKISFTEPYKFSGGKWMNDICVRTELNEGKAPDILICMVINYYDFDIFRDKIDQYKEKETTEVMILHYKNDLMVIYDSLYFMTEFECHGNDPNCVLINFFNVYYKSILD